VSSERLNTIRIELRHPSSVGSLAPCGGWQSVGRRYGDVQEVSDAEFGLGKGLVIIDSFLARAGHSDFAHLEVIVPEVGIHHGKVEVGALLPRVRIDVTHQGSQFVKGGVLPGVDLQLVGGHVAKGVFLNRVVATSGAEHAEKQRAGLKRG